MRSTISIMRGECDRERTYAMAEMRGPLIVKEPPEERVFPPALSRGCKKRYIKDGYHSNSYVNVPFPYRI